MKFKFCFFFTSILALLQGAQAKDTNIYHRNIKWLAVQSQQVPEATTVQFLNFEGATYDVSSEYLPLFFEQFSLNKNTKEINAQLTNQEFAPLSAEEIAIVKKKNSKLIGNTIRLIAKIGYEKKSPIALISFVPIQINSLTGIYEKLISFNISITPVIYTQKNTTTSLRTYSSNSVLKSGNWFKIGVTKDGIYKLSYDFLMSLGLDSNVNPKNIRIYGNGGGMLPYANAVPVYDDLMENAIFVSEENDGQFDKVDYVLFYGQSPHRWKYNTDDQRFHHITNQYSDTTYYFLTANAGIGKRIQTRNSSTLTPNHTVTSFDDYAFHEEDKVNLILSGREWYGEAFDILTTYDFPFTFPNLDFSVPVYLNSDVIARSYSISNFSVKANGQQILTESVPPISTNYTDSYAQQSSSITSATFTATSSNITISLIYDKPASTSIGWLNYLELNVKQHLTLNTNQMLFRSIASVGAGNISEFAFSNTPSTVQIWDVTDPINVVNQSTDNSSQQLRFAVPTEVLREFIAFTGITYLSPTFAGKIENQNLHASSQTDMLIVTHPKFMNAANKLADFHKNNDSISVLIVTPQQIYNEFSSGAQDISAIRNFVKMFYDRGGSDSLKMPKYLLLLGDGSYDNKYRLTDNTNYIPTYQSVNSLDPTGSYVSDDYYGLLDDSEGQWNTYPLDPDLPDIAIGRFPVKSAEEADAVVNKIFRYTSKGGLNIDTCSSCPATSSSSFGDWRNVVCFIADDQDMNTHESQADALATMVYENYKNYNIDKIYFDAYKQEATPGGQRYPDVNDAFNKRVEKGALVINYTGHGGEAGLAHERILDISMINAWNNINNLFLFFTATCEFSRFDNPDYTSAGEFVLLNPQGGGIGLMTTVRLVYSSPNFTLNQNFYNTVFTPVNGELPPAMGEVFRRTKVASGPSVNNRNFTFLGDPALRLDYPYYNVATIAINAKVVSSTPDTLKALSKITVKGEIRNKQGKKLSDFNGVIYPIVFDKAATIATLGNDQDSPVTSFKLQKNVVYKGKASVRNGDFSFTFIIPKDISYQYGYAKISYYGHNGIQDASGYYDSIVIGGISSGFAKDVTGPRVKLYMNDEKFVYGGTTNENPNLYAVLFDSSGINTVGNGIGHDITATLDDDSKKILVLNDYYKADLNSYQSGKITYPLSKLSTGQHKMQLKTWDVYNNSSDATTEFIVAPSAQFALTHVLNYPNPFTTHTQFYFDHNRPFVALNVQVQIFTVSGKLVKTLSTMMQTIGYHSDPIDWDGLDDFGNKIGRGVYIYRLKVQSNDGLYADEYQKLIILR